MSRVSRRQFLGQGPLGLAVLTSGGVLLHAQAPPTEGSGTLGAYGRFLAGRPGGAAPPAAPAAAVALKPTEDNILGPFHRTGAPFRAKITPPLEAGVVLLIKGRVWGHDTKKPLVHAILDIWQANAKGRYDNDDPRKPPAADVFLNRARLITDENGFYEFESVHPGAYKTGPTTWRPSHVHYMVRHPGYKTLVTQLYFKGDPHNKDDEFIKDSLIIEVGKAKAGTVPYETGTFDIVLAAAPK